jgi:hypothetical protein
MLACPFGPEWDTLVKEVGKFQAYRDYLQHVGEIRTPEEVKSKLASEGIMTSMYPAHQYQIERTPNTAATATVEVFTSMAEALLSKFPEGYTYRLEHRTDVPWKGYVEPANPNSVGGKPTIVINTAKASLDTPLHEFGHIFLNMVRQENIRLYFQLMNGVFTTETVDETAMDPKTGKEVTRKKIVGYKPKDKYKTLFEEIQRLYPNSTEEEHAEELITELLGRYASEYYDPATGKVKKDFESDDSILKGIASTLKKIWEAIKDALFRNTVLVEVKDLNPNATIENLAMILAHPMVKFNVGSMRQKVSEQQVEGLKKRLTQMKSLKDSFIADPTITLVRSGNYQYLLTKKQGERLELIRSKLPMIRAYVDTNPNGPKIRHAKGVYGGSTKFRNGLEKLASIYLEKPNMSTQEKLAVLDRPEFSRVKTILQAYPDGLDYVVEKVSGPNHAYVIDQAVKDAAILFWGSGRGSASRDYEQHTPEMLLKQLLDGSDEHLNRIFNFPKAFAKTHAIIDRAPSVQTVLEAIDKKIQEYTKAIESPSAYFNKSRRATFKVSSVRPTTGEVIEDEITVAGNLREDGDVEVSFSSDIWSMTDPYWIVPATERNIGEGSRVVKISASGRSVSRSRTSERMDTRDEYGVVEHDNTSALILPAGAFREYMDAKRNGDNTQMEYWHNKATLVPINTLEVKQSQDKRALDVMNGVVETLAAMFEDVDYTSFIFTPMSGESLTRETGEMREKLYNLTAKRLFGRWSPLGEGVFSRRLMVPNWFRPGIKMEKPVYQMDSAPDSLNQFVEDTADNMATLGIEAIRGSIKVDERTQDNASGVGAIKAFARGLAGQLTLEGKPVNYAFIDTAEAQRLTEGKKNPWSGEKAFFIGDTVYFVGDNISLSDVFHEFAHPFVRTLFYQNEGLFRKLYQDLVSTQEGIALYNQVKLAYPELNDTDPLFMEEMLVRAITTAANLEQQGKSESKGFAKFMKDLLYAIKQMLRKAFGQSSNVSKLGPNTTIKQLADMLKEGKNFILDEQVTENIDTVAYVRDTRKFIEDVAMITKPELMSITVRAHDIALKHIDTVMRNKNYREIASILADEFKRGDLQEIQRNLNKFAKPLEDKLRAKRDEVEYNKAHAEALVNTFFRLQNMVGKIKEHMKELSKDPDSIDNMHKAYYYDYLLRYWSDYIDEVIETMNEAEVPETSPLSELVTSIKRGIESSKDYTKKMYATGVKDVLYSELRPMAERIAERYSKIIENLKKNNADPKLIDKWMMEYYGLNQEELARKEGLENAYKNGLITTEQKKELDFLRKKSLDGAQITDEKIEMALKGELKDANVFNSFFEGYMYNTDPVIGGFALYVKNQMSDVMNAAMVKFNDYAKDLKPLLEAAGYNPANVNELIEKVGRRELIGKIDSYGKWVEKEVWTLKSAHTGWRIAMDRARRAIDDAQRQYSMTGTSEDHEKLVEAVADRKKLLRDYFHQEYDKKVYARDYMLEKGYKVVDGVDIGIEAAYRRDKIFELMAEISNPLTTQMEHLEMAEQMDNLWREYHQLYSLVDLNGKLKTGVDREVALLLKEHRAAGVDTDQYLPDGSLNPNYMKSFHDWKLRTGVFENTLAQFEQELVNKYGKDTPEFNFFREQWIKKNTRTVIKPEFYEERKKILEAIDTIMAKLPDAQQKKLNVSEMWSQILDLTAGNRDEDGQPNGLNFTEQGIAFIKEKQLEIQKAMEKFAGLSGLNKQEAAELQGYWDVINAKERRLTPEEQERFNALMSISDNTGLSKLDKQKLFGLFAKLQGLQKKEATDYYVSIMNNWLSKLNTGLMMNELGTNTITREAANMILEDHVINPLLQQDEEFKTWFKNNHIRKTVYDKESGQQKEIWERIYAWNVVRPVEKEFYEQTEIKREDGTSEIIDGLPSLKYYARVVKPQYRTERVVGVTVDNQGNFLPRTDVADSPYIDHEYMQMSKTDPKHYAILEKMKEHHLKNQESLGYKNRLYLDIPRYRKNALEVVRTKKLKVIAGGLGEKNFPFLQIMVERVKNFFRKAKDQKGSEYNWEDDAVLVRADMFDNEIASIPISGLYDIDIDDTSVDVNQSLMRYMFSAERHKKLVEINPVAQALKTTVNDPKNLAKQMDRINKFNFIHRGVVTYLNKKGRYTRQAAVNNFIEREFEGQVDAGFTKDMPWLQNASNIIMGRAAFSFFALNIPSAVKNAIGAKWQAMIHMAGGIDVDAVSMSKGEGWSFNTMAQISSQIYTRGPKPLNMQILDSFDAIRERAEDKLPESMSRTFMHDAVNFSWLMNFRKWTEMQATAQLFAGMMYKQKVDMKGKEIYYMDAWETRDGQLRLKDGIDVRWSNIPTEYTVQEGDTMASLAAKFNMSEEDLRKEISGKLKAGKEITINNGKYKAFKNRVHSVTMNLNGAYSKFDQPEAQRYLAFRHISFLKRFFTTMFVNRWGYSGSILGAKRGRVNPGMGDIHEGYYVTTLKTLWRTIEFGGKNLPHMTPEERAALKKTLVEVMAAIALLMVVAPMLGWDPTDPERYEKLRKRSGNLPFFGLVPEDPEHPFNMGGWLMNHALLMTLQVRAENEAFIPWMGFGLDNYYETFTDATSIGYGPTLKSYKQMLEYLYMEMTGNPYAYYQKDAGPYEWQKEGGSKLMTTFWKSLGLTGGSIDPVTAIKNNPTLSSGSSKMR